MPFSHELPYLQFSHPEYDSVLTRLARQLAAAYETGTLLDVGANVGDSAARLRAGCDFPILCVEGDPYYSSFLRSNAERIGGRVVIEEIYVGGEDEIIQARGVRVRGTSRLEASGGSSQQIVSLRALLRNHRDLPPLRLVKSDTDGFDWAIMEGGLPIWQELHPVLLFECDPVFYPDGWDPRPLLRRLSGAGFRTLLAYENDGQFLTALDTRDERAIEALYAFLVARRGRSYLDVCIFHEADAAIAEAFRSAEVLRILQRRTNVSPGS